jgi:ribose transport system substrate-binding protein
MSIKKIFICLILVLTITLSVIPVGGFAEEKQVTIGVSFMTLNSPFFVAINRGLASEAKAAGVRLVVTDAQLNLAKQISSVENLIAQRVDVILLNPVDSTAVGPAVEAANKAGIPVIALDVTSQQGKIESLIASNNKTAGLMAADFIAGKLGKQGTVAILNGPPISSFMDRIDGFKSGIAKYPKIKIVREKKVVENSITKFMEAADNILTAVPKLDAIFAVNDFGAIAVKSIVESSNRKFHVFSVGVDGMPDAIDAIAEHKTIAATIAQQPAEMGKLGIQAALDAVQGKKLQPVIAVPLKLVTSENAKGFSW